MVSNQGVQERLTAALAHRYRFERDFMLVFCLSWPGEDWRIPDDPRFHEALDRLRNPKK